MGEVTGRFNTPRSIERSIDPGVWIFDAITGTLNLLLSVSVVLSILSNYKSVRFLSSLLFRVWESGAKRDGGDKLKFPFEISFRVMQLIDTFV